MKRFDVKCKRVARCPMCGIRLNMTMPYCSKVCSDSNDAEYRREMERLRLRVGD